MLPEITSLVKQPDKCSLKFNRRYKLRNKDVRNLAILPKLPPSHKQQKFDENNRKGTLNEQQFLNRIDKTTERKILQFPPTLDKQNENGVGTKRAKIQRELYVKVYPACDIYRRKDKQVGGRDVGATNEPTPTFHVYF